MLRSRVTLGKYIVYCILVSLLVLVITDASMGYMAFRMDFKVILGLSVGVNILLYLIYLYPVIAIGLGALIPLSSAAYYIISRESFLDTVNYIWQTAVGCVDWLYRYMYDVAYLYFPYMRIVLVVFIILLTIVLFYLMIAKHYAVFTMAAGVVYLSFMWFFGYDEAFSFLQWYIFICFAAYGFIHFDRLESGWKLKQDKYSKIIGLIWGVSIAVMLGLVYLFLQILPNKIEPVSIQWLNDNVFSMFYGYGNRGTYGSLDLSDRLSISNVGFSGGDSKLGGSVKMSNKLLLKVKVDGSIIPPIYLRGAVKDYYSGTMWTVSSETRMNIPVNDWTNAGLSKYMTGDDSLVKDFKEESITVYPQSINNLILFNLWEPDSVKISGSFYAYDSNGQLSMSNANGSVKEYTVTSKIPQVYSDELEKPKAVSSPDTLKSYLELPDSLPQRVKDLTHSITDKYNTDYEKAEAIQSYLRSTYPYTLQTSELPNGRDFVDYFLFDEKKGYCTYYATAMAVMCRIAGIPTRYVEGLILTSADRDSATGLYNGYSSRAHAWVELYFNGYGWVQFEPTSSYVAPDYERPSAGNEIDTSENPQDNTIPIDNQHSGKDMMDDETGSTGGTGNSQSLPLGLWIGLALIAAVIIRISAKVIINLRKIRLADGLKGKEAAMEYFRILENSLRLGGIGMGPGETPAEFGERLKDFMSSNDVDVGDIIAVFNRIRFGNSPMDDSAREKLKSIIKEADRLVKYRRGVIKYAFTKYIL